MDSNPTKDYYVGVTIGEGSFGRVVHARHKTSKKDVAIKVFEKISLRKHPLLMPSILNERSLLMQFQSSPSVVNLWGAFHDSECLYLVMECLKGGDLQDLIAEGTSEGTDMQWWAAAVVPHYALQLSHAVEFLHKNHIIHGDLKPANILVTPRGRLQLADFGSAVRLDTAKEGHDNQFSSSQQQSSRDNNDENHATSILGGTVDFASPEILRGTCISNLTIGSDLWSLGAIFHAMLTGQSPFHAASDSLAMQSIMDYSNGTTIPFILSSAQYEDNSYSSEWKDLILGLLHPIPENRSGTTVQGTIGSPTTSISTLIPGFEMIDLEKEPPFLPSEPKWVSEARETEMRDGSKGWSSFLI